MFKKETKEMITLDSYPIFFKLKRSFRKTITLKVNEAGLTINAPFLVTRNHIFELIHSKKKWILSKLEFFKEKNSQIIFCNDKVIKILNKEYIIKITIGKNKVFLNKNLCFIQTKNINEQSQIKKIFIKWLKNYALEYFEKEAEIIANMHGFKFNKIKLSNAKSRWGTCNEKKIIRLNWRLILSSPEIVNYVICHELSHIIHMNHSKKFWSLVESICPNYKYLSNELKKQGISLYRLG